MSLWQQRKWHNSAGLLEACNAKCHVEANESNIAVAVIMNLLNNWYQNMQMQHAKILPYILYPLQTTRSCSSSCDHLCVRSGIMMQKLFLHCWFWRSILLRANADREVIRFRWGNAKKTISNHCTELGSQLSMRMLINNSITTMNYVWQLWSLEAVNIR